MQVTVDTIVDYLKDCVEHKIPVDAHTWVDAAQKLTVLLGDEHDKLFDLESVIAQNKMANIEEGDTVAKAQAKVETTAAYNIMRKQKARIGRIEEMVRIAKVQARLKDAELRGL